MNQNRLQQPPIFKLAFLTTMCERFGFYALTFLLVLYAKGEFGFSDTAAFALYAIFSGLAYLVTAMGGYLADNVIGIRRCLVVGLSLESIGLLILAYPAPWVFPISLAFLICGVGLFKTAPTHLLGRSYRDEDPRIDSGFTWYYMSINIGSLISAILIGIIQHYYGWSIAFFIGGVGALLGLVFYYFLRKRAKSCDSKIGLEKLPIKKWLVFGLGLIASIIICAFLVFHTTTAYFFYSVATIVLFSYFVFEIARSSKEDRKKILACLLLLLIGLVFFILFQQAYTSMELFIDRSVNRNLFGISIPTIAFFSLNASWIIILGPLLAMLYNSLERRNIKIAITTKFPLGLLAASLCFFTLWFCGFFHNANFQVDPLWIALAFFFYTLGEMLVSALGVAMITHIAPKRMYGVMMGTWYFVGMSMSAILSGFIANIASIPAGLTDHAKILYTYNHAFLQIGLFSLVFVVLAFAIAPYIKKIANL